MGPFLEAPGLEIYARYYFSTDCLQTPSFIQYLWGSFTLPLCFGCFIMSVKDSYLFIKIQNIAKP